MRPFALQPAETAICAHGRLRIRRGRSWLARSVATLCRLPRASDAAEVTLNVTRHGDSELWERTFDGCPLHTRQRRTTDGDLIEQFGCLEFRFRPIASGAGLLYAQRDVCLRIGRFRLKIPAVFAPRVEAREDPAGDGAITVNVRVVLPYAGVLIAYDGTVHTTGCQ